MLNSGLADFAAGHVKVGGRLRPHGVRRGESPSGRGSTWPYRAICGTGGRRVNLDEPLLALFVAFCK